MSRMTPQRKRAYELIGQRIRAARDRANMTQSELAVAMGTSQGTLAEIESGKTGPGVEAVPVYAKVLGVKLDDLLPTAAELASPSSIPPEPLPPITKRRAAKMVAKYVEEYGAKDDPGPEEITWVKDSLPRDAIWNSFGRTPKAISDMIHLRRKNPVPEK